MMEEADKSAIIEETDSPPVLQKANSPAAVLEAVQGTRQAGSPWLTNFFLQADALEKPCTQGRVRLSVQPQLALVLLEEDLFARLYYATSKPEALAGAMVSLRETIQKPLLSDIIGPPAPCEEVAASFLDAGFSRYARFLRMQRLVPKDAKDAQHAAVEAASPAPPTPTPAASSVEMAQPQDVEAIYEAVHGHFDPYMEHLPSRDEIQAAIAAQTILLCRGEASIAALLYFDRKGKMSILRYWLVEPAFRGQHLGGLLMRHYFAYCQGVRRFELWVDERNHNAIQKYTHYGYKEGRNIDLIMLAQPDADG